MHKMEAAELFGILSDPDRVKIMKMLCVRGDLSYAVLKEIIEDDLTKLEDDLKLLLGCGLIKCEGDIYSADRTLVDELMGFITTPCGCTR